MPTDDLFCITPPDLRYDTQLASGTFAGCCTTPAVEKLTPETPGTLMRYLKTCCYLSVLCSGASALTLEVLWQRQMFLVFGASAPSTTAVLTALFLGIAMGSLVVARAGHR
ncbi:MAG: hypothetical protein ACPGXX_22015, partial [Planctomycetaceae bacterium]